MGSVYSQENYRNCCHLMSDFKAKKAPNSMSAGAPTQIPLGELTVLPRLPADPIPALKMFFSPQSSDQRTVSALPFLWQFAWHSAMWRVQNQSIMQSRWKWTAASGLHTLWTGEWTNKCFYFIFTALHALYPTRSTMRKMSVCPSVCQTRNLW